MLSGTDDFERDFSKFLSSTESCVSGIGMVLSKRVFLLAVRRTFGSSTEAILFITFCCVLVRSDVSDCGLRPRMVDFAA